MNERQIQLIMQIVREQMDDYLTEDLVDEIAAGIEEGICDNMTTLEALA